MSRSNPNEDTNLVNPVKFFLEWKGKEGGFEYWDKTNKKNVDMPLPFTFIPLCTCVTVKGYNKKKEIRYWSNEIRDIQKDKLTVRGKGKSGSIETYFEGFYKDLKEQFELNKINYVQSVYIAYKEKGGELQLANIQIKTSALGPWINFCKVNNINECGVTVKSFAKEQNGDVSFVAPVYTPVKISDETNKQAIELDKELQTYLKSYMERNQTSTEAVKHENKVEGEEKPKQEAYKYPDQPANIGADINLDDDMDEMPF